jgi:hypothetical protein
VSHFYYTLPDIGGSDFIHSSICEESEIRSPRLPCGRSHLHELRVADES